MRFGFVKVAAAVPAVKVASKIIEYFLYPDLISLQTRMD